MQRIRAFWQSGIIGKIVLSIAGLFALLIICCVGISLISSPKQNTVTKPTTVEVAVASTDRPTLAPATNTPAPTATFVATAIPRGYVSQTLMGDAWPLKIGHGIVVCDGRAILLRAPDGQLYAVNGLARGQIPHLGWKDIREITLPDPHIAGLIMNVQPIVDVGLTLCK